MAELFGGGSVNLAVRPYGSEMPDFVPTIDDETLERLVNREFTSDTADRVHSLLETYGAKPHHIERNRVRAAILKLANGDLRAIQQQVSVAVTDFRDVVGAAEYPRQMEIGFVGMSRVSEEHLQDLKNQDWKDYCDWLRKP